MKKITIVFFSVFCLSFICILGCNDDIANKESNSFGPVLSGANTNEGIVSLERLNPNLPGDPLENPDNFIVVTPVMWDGESKFENGVRYRVTREQIDRIPEIIEKKPELAEHLVKVYDDFMRMIHRIDQSRKVKESGPKLASEFASADCFGGSAVAVHAQADGVFGWLAQVIVGIDDDWDVIYEQGGDPIALYMICLSGCFQGYAYASDGWGAPDEKLCYN